MRGEPTKFSSIAGSGAITIAPRMPIRRASEAYQSQETSFRACIFLKFAGGSLTRVGRFQCTRMHRLQNMEVELKLQLPARSLSKLRNSPLLRALKGAPTPDALVASSTEHVGLSLKGHAVGTARRSFTSS
jgi:hypothetical protein